MAASVGLTGSETPVIIEPETSTLPVPFGLITMLPLVSVEEIVLPLILILSTVSSVTPAIEVVVEPSVNVEEPRVIFLAVTAPEVTVKLLVSKDATPLLVVVASSPATVIVVPA